MYHFFVDPGQIGPTDIAITGSDVNHIRNVLRMQPGEQITVSSGEDEKEYRCEIRALSEEEVTAHIMWVEETGAELPSRISLFQGLPKADKMELVIQKAVELGAYELVPMATRRAVVKLDAKKEAAKLKRCRILNGVQPGQSVAVLIGPEGGFEENEIQYAKEKGVLPITLGRRILRTETAGMTVLAALMMQLEGRQV